MPGWSIQSGIFFIGKLLVKPKTKEETDSAVIAIYRVIINQNLPPQSGLYWLGLHRI